MGPTGNLQIIAASNGWEYSTSTSEITTKHRGIVVVGDCVISSWTVTDGAQTIDLVDKFGIDGVTITTDFPALMLWGDYVSESITFSTNGGVCSGEVAKGGVNISDCWSFIYKSLLSKLSVVVIHLFLLL